MSRLSYKILLLFTLLATLGGLLTLMPRQAASYPNLIGYLSLCTFAPAATFYCFTLAGLSCFVRSAFIKNQSGTLRERFGNKRKSLIPLALLLAAGLFFNYRYIKVKEYYADTATSATVQE